MKIKGSYIWATVIAVGVAGWMFSGNFSGSNTEGAGEVAANAAVSQDGAQPAAADATATTDKPFIVSAVTVENNAIRRMVRANGVTQPNFVVTVSAQITGTVIDVPAKEGTAVQKGDVLVVFDKGTLPTQIDAARAELVAAETAYDAALNQSGGTFEEELAAARANLEVAKQRKEVGEKLAKQNFSAPLEQAQLTADYENARVALAKIEMAQNYQADVAVSQNMSRVAAAKSALSQLLDQEQDSVITAPVSGWLESVDVDMGERLGREAPAATILGMDELKVVVAVPQTDVAQISVGDLVDVTVAGVGLRKGSVSKIASQTSSTTRTFDVEITLANPDQAMRAGVTVEASIDIGFTPAYAMSPAHLSVAGDGSLTAKVSDDGTVRVVPVDMVRSGAERVFVSGLPDGAHLLTFGQAFVEDGDTVQTDFGDAS